MRNSFTEILPLHERVAQLREALILEDLVMQSVELCEAWNLYLKHGTSVTHLAGSKLLEAITRGEFLLKQAAAVRAATSNAYTEGEGW